MMPVTATGATGGNKEQAGQIRAAHCAQVRGESRWGWACLLVDMAPASTRFAALAFGQTCIQTTLSDDGDWTLDVAPS